MRNSKCVIIFVPHICYETLEFRRGGFHIRPLHPYFMQNFYR